MPFLWHSSVVKAAMDTAGRVVIPKALRTVLGFKPGQVLEARITDGRLELEIPPTPMKLTRSGRGVAAVPTKGKLPPLGAAQVRETLERTRR